MRRPRVESVYGTAYCGESRVARSAVLMESALRLIQGDAHQWSEQTRSCPAIRGSGHPTKLTEPRLGPVRCPGPLQQNKHISTLGGLADHLVKLGSPFRFDAALIRGATERRDHGAIMGQLIQVLDKLEKGVE